MSNSICFGARLFTVPEGGAPFDWPARGEYKFTAKYLFFKTSKGSWHIFDTKQLTGCAGCVLV